MTESDRKTSTTVTLGPRQPPHVEVHSEAAGQEPERWEVVEEAFLRVMWEDDGRFRSGVTSQQENQRAKSRSFEDLIVFLVQNAAGMQLGRRGLAEGVFFRRYELAAFHPASGDVDLIIDTKVAGAPRGSRNARHKHPLGRPGSRDLKQWLSGISLKVIDLKARRRDGRVRVAVRPATWFRGSVAASRSASSFSRFEW